MLGDATAVMLEFEKDGIHARDNFRRLLCYVWLNGKNLCVEQVRAGHSVYWTKYGKSSILSSFKLPGGKLKLLLSVDSARWHGVAWFTFPPGIFPEYGISYPVVLQLLFTR
jgi:hypothetical protein